MKVFISVMNLLARTKCNKTRTATTKTTEHLEYLPLGALPAIIIIIITTIIIIIVITIIIIIIIVVVAISLRAVLLFQCHDILLLIPSASYRTAHFGGI